MAEMEDIMGITGEEYPASRDPEDRPTDDEQSKREKNLDKTLADSFPTSDPPSTIPDPSGEI